MAAAIGKGYDRNIGCSKTVKDGVVNAWNWITDKAFIGADKFFSETVWEKWIVDVFGKSSA